MKLFKLSSFVLSVFSVALISACGDQLADKTVTQAEFNQDQAAIVSARSLLEQEVNNGRLPYYSRSLVIPGPSGLNETDRMQIGNAVKSMPLEDYTRIVNRLDTTIRAYQAYVDKYGKFDRVYVEGRDDKSTNAPRVGKYDLDTIKNDLEFYKKRRQQLVDIREGRLDPAKINQPAAPVAPVTPAPVQEETPKVKKPKNSTRLEKQEEIDARAQKTHDFPKKSFERRLEEMRTYLETLKSNDPSQGHNAETMRATIKLTPIYNKHVGYKALTENKKEYLAYDKPLEGSDQTLNQLMEEIRQELTVWLDLIEASN